MVSQKKVIAIIGYGDFGRLLAKYLGKNFDVVVSSRQRSIEEKSVKHVDLETALSKEMIIPAIPAQALEEFFVKNKKMVNPKALIIDVCSVKEKPVEVLTRVLPKSVQILATHPMFGPASAANGIKGKSIMLYPARIPKDRYERIKKIIAENYELKIIETTPEEHDKMMAYVQGLSHYVGRIMQLMRIPETELATDAYKDLLDMKRIQGQDSWDLFESIMFENQNVEKVIKRFRISMKKLNTRLGIDDSDS